MSTQMIIYLTGSVLIIAIFARWSWQQEKDKDITLSDLTFFFFVSFMLGIFSWAGVFCWLFIKLGKYSDKVIIRRKRNRTMSKAEKENRINSLAVTFLERQQIRPNIFADQIIRGYKECYHQAEKDLALTWEDMRMIDLLCCKVDMSCDLEEKEYYQEVLKRFKERKGKIV